MDRLFKRTQWLKEFQIRILLMERKAVKLQGELQAVLRGCEKNKGRNKLCASLLLWQTKKVVWVLVAMA